MGELKDTFAFAVRFPGRQVLTFGTLVVVGFGGGMRLGSVAASATASPVLLALAQAVGIGSALGVFFVLPGYPLMVTRAAAAGADRAPPPWAGRGRGSLYGFLVTVGEGAVAFFAFVPHGIVLLYPLALVVEQSFPLPAALAVSLPVAFFFPAAIALVAVAPPEETDDLFDPRVETELIGVKGVAVLTDEATIELLKNAGRAYAFGTIFDLARTRGYARLWVVLLFVSAYDAGVFYLLFVVSPSVGGTSGAAIVVVGAYLLCAGLLVGASAVGRAYRSILSERPGVDPRIDAAPEVSE